MILTSFGTYTKRIIPLLAMSTFLWISCELIPSHENDFVHEELNYFKRNQLIKQTCAKFGISTTIGEFKEKNVSKLNLYQRQLMEYKSYVEEYRPKPLLHNEKYSLCYCGTAKVASSSWKTLLLKLAQLKVPKKPSQVHLLAKNVMGIDGTKSQNIFADNSSLRFFFSRHPFDRLVSAYVDKFALSDEDGVFYKNYAAAIRRANSKENSTEKPSFKEFIRYVLSLETMGDFNPHWIPQWLHCNICQWNFQVPGHMETIAEDSNYIAQKANLSISVPWKNNCKDEDKGSNTSNKTNRTKSESRTTSYLKELDVDQIQKLHRLYLMDFEMLGYLPDTFFD